MKALLWFAVLAVTLAGVLKNKDEINAWLSPRLPTVDRAKPQLDLPAIYARAAQQVSREVYGGQAEAIESFRPALPADYAIQRGDGTWAFSGKAIVRGLGPTFTDRWAAIYDPQTDLITSARSLGSIEADAPRFARVPDWPKAMPASTNARPEAGRRRTWSQLPDGRWIEHDASVSAMRSIGGG